MGNRSVCQRNILDNSTAIQSKDRAASDAVAMARGVDTGPLPEEREIVLKTEFAFKNDMGLRKG